VVEPQRPAQVRDDALSHALRVPFGYWEAKNEEDDLDAEIEKKFRRGSPQDSIVFEDSREAVLIQNRQEVTRCPVDDPERLEKLLGLFFSHERPEIAELRQAVAQFKADLPTVLEALRSMIEQAETENPAFLATAMRFLERARETINPCVTAADVRETLIQHIHVGPAQQELNLAAVSGRLHPHHGTRGHIAVGWSRQHLMLGPRAPPVSGSRKFR
jgi:hypothetical protein